MRKRHIVLGSVAASFAMSASTFAVTVCKPAEVLHSERCTITSNNDYCRRAGYYEGGAKGTDVITYGQIITPGSKNFGDAYDCDVNGDGDFDIENERFYYLADYDDAYSSLIWSKNSAISVQYSYNDAMSFVPGNASANLPNSSNWSNVTLRRNPRTVHRLDSTGETSEYSYTNNTSRFLSLEDFEKGFPGDYSKITNKTQFVLKDYAFLFESTRFATRDSELPGDFWMEESIVNGESNCTNSYGQNCGVKLSSYDQRVWQSQWSERTAVRPVIEVPNDQISSDFYEYSITYELNGGSVDGDNPTGYKFTDSYTLINPTRQGYVFDGWFVNDNESESFETISVSAGNYGNVKYTASWTPATNTAYTVHHRKQLASGAYDTTDANTDNLTGTTGAKVTPDRKSYDGYDSPAGVEIEILADGSTDLVYYYDLKSYTISIDLAGGSVDGENPTSYRIVDSYSLINPTRAGYAFAGWKVNAGDEVYDNISVSEGHFGDISYAATWETVDYTISYELDGGTNGEKNPSGYNVESGTITLVAPTKTGYVFDGWATLASGENKSMSVTIPTGSTGDKTYYAMWTPATNTKYTVIHSKQNASGGYSDADKESEELYGTTDTDVYPDVKDYSGYTAPSTRKLTIAADGSASLEYQYTLDSYTIGYTLGDNATASGNPTSYTVLSGPITLNNPTRTGYLFTGWSLLGRDGMNMTEIIPTGSTGNRDYTANWQLETYQIDYELNGGSVEGGNPTAYTVEDEFDLIAPTQNDYTFAGWSLGNDETIVPGKIAAGTTGDKTFVAHWTALPGPDDPIVPVDPEDPDVPIDPEVPEDTAGDTPDTRDFVAKNAGVSLVSFFVIVALYWFTRRGRRTS